MPDHIKELNQNEDVQMLNLDGNLITEQDQDEIEQMMSNQNNNHDNCINNYSSNRSIFKPHKRLLDSQNFGKRGQTRKTAIGNVYVPNSIFIAGLKVK